LHPMQVRYQTAPRSDSVVLIEDQTARVGYFRAGQ
jgi:hypothetical protein